MPSSTSDSLLIFQMGEQRLALSVAAVERVVAAVEITPLADAPRGVRGVIDVQGRMVPVFDLTARPGEPVRASDHLILARTPQRTVALLVEAVESVGPRLGDGPEPIPDLELFLAREKSAPPAPRP